MSSAAPLLLTLRRMQQPILSRRLLQPVRSNIEQKPPPTLPWRSQQPLEIRMPALYWWIPRNLMPVVTVSKPTATPVESLWGQISLKNPHPRHIDSLINSWASYLLCLCHFRSLFGSFLLQTPIPAVGFTLSYLPCTFLPCIFALCFVLF